MSDVESEEQRYTAAVQSVLNKAFAYWAPTRTSKAEIDDARASMRIQRVSRAHRPDRLEYLLSSACYAKLQNVLQLSLGEHPQIGTDGIRPAQLRERTIDERDPDTQMTQTARTYAIVIPLGLTAASPLAPRNLLVAGGPHIAFACVFGLLALILRWLYIQPTNTI